MTTAGALRLNGSLEGERTVPAQEEAVAHALETRPDLLTARAMELAAGAELKRAETEGKLDATLSGSYERNAFSIGLNGITDAGQAQPIQEVFHQLRVGLSLQLPVRNKNQGEIAAATAGIEAARRQREYAELIARREVASAYLARDKAQQSLELYRRGVLEQAEKNLSVIRRVYELGRNQLLDVISEQRRLIDLELGFTETLNRYYQANVRLRAAANLN
jgi:cobalt-zinc-cadmium efflux system outer membrane protein